VTEPPGLGIESHYPKMIGSIQPATCLPWLSVPVGLDVATLLGLILSKLGEMTQVNSASKSTLVCRRLISKLAL